MNPSKNKSIGSIAWLAAVIGISVMLALVIGWRMPGLELYARDALMRTRGAQAAPDDILIVAVDEASLKGFGRFPWPRSVMARALDQLRMASPKAIALDILYSDPTDNENDSALAAAIARAGNVVAAAQLITDRFNENQIVWLRPIAEVERAAAAVGHVNVYTGFDGVARTLLPRQADDEARSLWAMAIELIRVGDGLPADAVRERPEAVMIGNRAVPISVDPANLTIESEGATAEQRSAARLMIDYSGSGFIANRRIGWRCFARRWSRRRRSFLPRLRHHAPSRIAAHAARRDGAGDARDEDAADRHPGNERSARAIRHRPGAAARDASDDQRRSQTAGANDR
jgi:hypothetical protein